MAVVGTPRKFQKKFAFIVEIEGIGSAAFQKCSELTAEIAKVEYFEGGSLIADKSPGRVTVEDVTLERGVADGDTDLYQWWLDVVRMSANAGPSARGVGLATPGYKRPVRIIQLDRNGAVLQRYLLDNAWPSKYSAGDWDNEADENRIESLVVTFDTFDLIDETSGT